MLPVNVSDAPLATSRPPPEAVKLRADENEVLADKPPLLSTTGFTAWPKALSLGTDSIPPPTVTGPVKLLPESSRSVPVPVLVNPAVPLRFPPKLIASVEGTSRIGEAEAN